MRKIDVKITKAQIQSFSVELKEKEPVVSANIVLFTDGERAIANYQVTTEEYSWNKESHFDLPVSAIPHIKSIMQILERVVAAHAQSSALELRAGGDDE